MDKFDNNNNNNKIKKITSVRTRDWAYCQTSAHLFLAISRVLSRSFMWIQTSSTIFLYCCLTSSRFSTANWPITVVRQIIRLCSRWSDRRAFSTPSKYIESCGPDKRAFEAFGSEFREKSQIKTIGYIILKFYFEEFCVRLNETFCRRFVEQIKNKVPFSKRREYPCRCFGWQHQHAAWPRLPGCTTKDTAGVTGTFPLPPSICFCPWTARAVFRPPTKD